MNIKIIKRIITVIITVILTAGTSIAQVMDNVEFLRSGAADGLKILEAYMTPYANAFGAGLNGSWYNTARPHKFGGFDITASFNVGMVPENAGTYDVSSLGLTTLTGSGTASTVSGPAVTGPSLTKSVSGTAIASFNLPSGTDWRYIPVPTANLGVGLPLGTELKVRYMPTIKIKDGDIGLWGVGLMHSIMQYIPGSKMFPFDVSLFGGYTKLQGHVPLDLPPGSPSSYQVYNSPDSFDDQILAASVTAMTISAVASLNIPVITVYGGLGYSKTKTSLVLEGNYPTPVFTATPVPGPVYNDSGVLSGDELPKVSIDNHSGLRANVGVRFKLALLTIHADYTRSQYNVFSAGVGISFR